jgi:hypothetical protein
MAAEPEIVRLPAPGRLAWMAMLALGVGVGWSGGAGIAGLDDPPAHLFVLLGTGIAFAGAALAVLLHREGPIELRIGPRDLVVAWRRESVPVPLAQIAEVVIEDTQPRGKRVLALRMRDGGVIEIAALHERRATSVADRMRAAVAVAADDQAADAAGAAEASTLRTVRGIADLGAIDAVELEWSAAADGAGFAAALPFVGMAVAAYGIYRAAGGFVVVLAIGFLLVLALGSLVVALKSLGTQRRLRIDARAVVAEHRRGRTALDRREVPVADVVGVDFMSQMHALGAALVVRGETARAHAPLGRLSRPACIALDLAVATAIARRKRAAPIRGKG